MFKADMTERLGTLSEHQTSVCLDAYHRKSSYVMVAMEKAQHARAPIPYFVAICSRVVDETPLVKPKTQQHDLAPVGCRDCGDTGFVILTRDVGPDALAGDAAPCHCAAGMAKLHKENPWMGSTGTPVNLPSAPMINYGPDDYEPLVPDATAELWSLKDYAIVEQVKGKAQRDPHLNNYLLHGGPHTRAVAAEIGWDWD